MLTSTCEWHEYRLTERRTFLTGINEIPVKHVLYTHITFWKYTTPVYYITEYTFHNANAAHNTCELVSTSVWSHTILISISYKIHKPNRNHLTFASITTLNSSHSLSLSLTQTSTWSTYLLWGSLCQCSRLFTWKFSRQHKITRLCLQLSELPIRRVTYIKEYITI
jgi:hypothetical protein